MTEIIEKARAGRLGRAKNLLKRAGYADGGGTPKPNFGNLRERLGLRTSYLTDAPERAPTSAEDGRTVQLGTVVGASGDDQGRTRDPRDNTPPATMPDPEPERRGGKVRRLGRRHAKKFGGRV